MLAVRNISARLPRTLTTTTSFVRVGCRHYNGDPGPQTSAHRKSQRQRLRESTNGNPRKAQAISADNLGVILGAEYTPPAPRYPPRSAESGSRPRPFGKRHDNRFDGTPDGFRMPFNRDRSGVESYGKTEGFRDRSDRRSPFPSRGRESGDSRYTQPYNRTNPRPPPVRFTLSGDKTEVRNEEDPYTTGRLLKEHIQSSSSPMTDKQIEAAVTILEDAPKVSVNVVVWNMLLGMMGREGKLERMWKSFNDMKKAGIKPSAHTYTALLNSYAGLSHSHSPTPSTSSPSISPKSLSRVAIIWSQARTYMDTYRPAPTGLDIPADTAPHKENLLGPVNAYLKFLARAGMSNEMWTVYQEAKGRGEVWDRVGYTTLIQALLLVARRQAADTKSGGIKQEKKVAVGPMAREVWDDAVKYLGGKKGEEGGLDNPLAVLGVGMLMMGRPDDQRYAMGLIPAIWGLTPLPTSSAPSPIPITSPNDIGAPSTATSEISPSSTLPRLKLDVKTATTLIQCLTSASRPTLAAHYASILLSTPYIRRRADPPFLYACTTAFADTGDPTSVLDLLNTFAPPATGWKLGFWYDCLTAARWARSEGGGGGKGDWESMRSILGWMGYIKGIIQRPGEGGRKGGKDVTGNQWPNVGMWEMNKPELDAKGMTIVLKTALGRGKGEITEAMGILERAGLGGVLGKYQDKLREGERVEKKWEWYEELSKEVVRATDRAGGECLSRETAEMVRCVQRLRVEGGEVGSRTARVGLHKAWKR